MFKTIAKTKNGLKILNAIKGRIELYKSQGMRDGQKMIQRLMTKICKMPVKKLKTPMIEKALKANHSKLVAQGTSKREIFQILGIYQEISLIMTEAGNLEKEDKDTSKNSVDFGGSNYSSNDQDELMGDELRDPKSSLLHRKEEIKEKVEYVIKTIIDRIEETSSSDEYMQRSKPGSPSDSHMQGIKRKYEEAFGSEVDHFSRQYNPPDLPIPNDDDAMFPSSSKSPNKRLAKYANYKLNKQRNRDRRKRRNKDYNFEASLIGPQNFYDKDDERNYAQAVKRLKHNIEPELSSEEGDLASFKGSGSAYDEDFI